MAALFGSNKALKAEPLYIEHSLKDHIFAATIETWFQNHICSSSEVTSESNRFYYNIAFKGYFLHLLEKRDSLQSWEAWSDPYNEVLHPSI